MGESGPGSSSEELERPLPAAVQSLPVPYQTLDGDGRILAVNDAWTETTGYDRATAVGEPFASFLTSESERRFRERFGHDGDGLACELTLVRASGGAVAVAFESRSASEGDDPRYHCQFYRVEDRRDSGDVGVTLRSLVDSLPMGVVLESGDREVLAVNGPLLELFGLDDADPVVGSDGEALTRRLSDRLEDPSRFREWIDSQVTAGDAAARDRVTLPDGRTVARSYLPVRLPEGPGHLWLYADVTGEVERERELRQYERLFEVAPVGVFRTTTAGTVLDVNRTLARTLGYDDPAAVVAAHDDLAADLYADPDRREEFLDRLREEGVVTDFEYEAVGRDGRRCWLSMNARLLDTFVDGEQVVTGFTRDVTARKRRDSDLQTYKEIVERLSDPIMLQDCDGEFVVANEAVAEYAGMDAEALLGRDEFAFMDEEAAERIARKKQAVLETGEPIEYDVDPNFDAGGKRSFRTLRYPYDDESGDPAGTVAICRDITEQRLREKQLAVLGRVLRHNLRNAMTVVRGRAEQIETGHCEDPTAAAATIVETVDALVEQANKEATVTTLLREATGRTTVDVATLTAQTVSEVAAEHPEAVINLDRPESAMADVYGEFYPALRELVENAVVHDETTDPSVSVAVTTDDDAVEVTVADTGPGIPAVERSVLLGETDITPLSHGGGVGLWLVHWLVRLSDGTLTVDDNDPTGTVVTIRLPAA